MPPVPQDETRLDAVRAGQRCRRDHRSRGASVRRTDLEPAREPRLPVVV